MLRVTLRPGDRFRLGREAVTVAALAYFDSAAAAVTVIRQSGLIQTVRADALRGAN